jgi:hypothetical protein
LRGIDFNGCIDIDHEASAVTDNVCPPLPGEPAMLEPRPGWTELECRSWRAIGEGRPADINEFLGEAADPELPDAWTPARRLSAAFLQTIALHGPYCHALPRH